MTQKKIIEQAIGEAGSLKKLSELSGIHVSRISEWKHEKYSIGFDKLSIILKSVNLKLEIK